VRAGLHFERLESERGIMFGGKIGLPELLIVFAIGLLVFGPSKLAGLGKSLGEGIRGFKTALKDDESSKN
jgi:sec-independent protein translocase protein TatA